MKKMYLLLTAVAIAGGNFSFGQKSNLQVAPSKNVFEGPAPATTVNSNSASRAIIWQDDFSTPANWTIANDAGNTDNWVIGTTGPSGSFAIASIVSTTAANGFALFDSDLMCSGNQIGNLTNATAINLSANPAVVLEFEQYYRRYTDSSFVYVSNNGSTWTKFPVNPSLALNAATSNPSTVSLNISAVAGGQATVWIRFTFSSTSAQGQDGCDYAWMVDDVKISDASTNDLVLGDVFYGEYSKIPVGQQLPISFSGYVSNQGATAQTNVALSATVNSTLFGTSTPLASMPVAQTDSLVVTGTYTPGPVGSYSIILAATQTETDDNLADNVKTRTIAVTDSIFSRDNDFYTGSGLWWGAGAAYEIGNLFEVSANAEASSISFVLQGNTVAGVDVRAKLYEVDGNGDFVEIGVTDYHTIVAGDIPAASGANPVKVTLPFDGGNIALVPNAYLAMLEHGGGAGADVVIASGTDIIQPIGTTWLFDPAATAPNDWGYLTSTAMVRLNLHSNVGISDEKAGNGLNLFQNQPNPASQNTVITYETASNGNVALKIFNVAGKEVMTINEGNKTAGKHLINLNTANLSSGVYYYTLTAGDNSMSKKMVIIE